MPHGGGERSETCFLRACKSTLWFKQRHKQSLFCGSKYDRASSCSWALAPSKQRMSPLRLMLPTPTPQTLYNLPVRLNMKRLTRSSPLLRLFCVEIGPCMARSGMHRHSRWGSFYGRKGTSRKRKEGESLLKGARLGIVKSCISFFHSPQTSL